MALNLELILKHVGESLEMFSENVSIPVDALKRYEEGTEKPSTDVYRKIADYTSLPWEQFETASVSEISRGKVVVNDTWAPSEAAKTNLKKYLEEGVDFTSKDVLSEINKVSLCISNWRKPKVVFAGQSDTGKSTMINELVGGENVPAKWTPTTAISTYIKHISDKPAFIEESVWIFGKSNGEIWNPDRLGDEEYTRKFVIAKGDINLLEEYGIHQNEGERPREAYSAVVFVDADVLKDCDIVDLPGFAASEEDNALHEFATQKSKTDILIYLSRANGFLQDRDLDYLKVCMESLIPVERPDSEVGKLENLFIVATHAKSVNNGSAVELNEILDNQSRRLCEILKESAKAIYGQVSSLLPKRTEITLMSYSESDIRSRFFTYDKSLERLNKKYFESMEGALEKIPAEIQRNFSNGLMKIASSSKTVLKEKIKEYTEIIDNTKKYVELAKTLKAKEPARKAEQEARTKALKEKIENYKIESEQEITCFLNTYLCEDSLVGQMKSRDLKNKKNDKMNFVTEVNTIINDKIQTIIDEKAGKYTVDLNDFLNDYDKSLNISDSVSDIDTGMNTINAFVTGLSALGAIGASAAWLATSFVAEAALLFPHLASFGYFAAFGGAIGIAIAGALSLIIVIVKAVTWRKSLAKDIIKAYKKEDYESKMLAKADSYWDETNDSLDAGCQNIEKEWTDKIKEYESLSNEDELAERIKKLADLKKGLSFFEKMPMPTIG